jgi:hypothetical protein
MVECMAEHVFVLPNRGREARLMLDLCVDSIHTKSCTAPGTNSKAHAGSVCGLHSH